MHIRVPPDRIGLLFFVVFKRYIVCALLYSILSKKFAQLNQFFAKSWYMYVLFQKDYLEVAEQIKYLKSEFDRQKTLYDEKITSQKNSLKELRVWLSMSCPMVI